VTHCGNADTSTGATISGLTEFLRVLGPFLCPWISGRHARKSRQGGAGVYLYFNNYISLLVGPVFFTDRALQPGRAGHMGTTQLDVDIPLRRLHK